MNDYTFEEIAKAIECIDPGVSLVIADLPAAYDRMKLNGRWCVKAALPACYSDADIEEIFLKIENKLDEYCLKIERDVMMGAYWLFPIVEMEVENG